MRLLPLLLVFALALPAAQAQVTLFPYIGYTTAAGFDTESSDIDDTASGFLIGVAGEYPLPVELPLDVSLRPSIEYVFLPGEESGGVEFTQRHVQINADAVVRFGQNGPIAPYAGGGIVLGILGTREEDSNVSVTQTGSGIGFNLLGGVMLNGALPFGSPFVQVRYTSLEIEFDILGLEVNKESNGLSLMAGLAIPVTG